MILARPAVWPIGDPPHYLISDDVAVYLHDSASVTALSRVGIPIVLIQNLVLQDLVEALDPSVEHPLSKFPVDATDPTFIPTIDPIIDGGSPNTVYFSAIYDGGEADTETFSDLVIDGDVHRIYSRRGTAAEWTDANPIMTSGEPGVETDTRLLKFGDGVSFWSQLPYVSLDNTLFISNVLVSPTPPIITPPGMVWIRSEPGGVFDPTPPRPIPFTGSADLGGSGTLTAGAP